GEAYVATTRQQKIFVKRNSSPFLAILSAEGIVPKLLWTKRMFNGDVLSAQQFIEGRELSPADMKRADVAAQLGKIHHSKELL
ncbi:aminoglycoside phosphotransferase, partial [Klebsiella pneumoniae]|nr:aminoglycoside phosphotransferase [Klebsiella pneumoniae]